jgi:predicted HicB family RNase H-like nuclease
MAEIRPNLRIPKDSWKLLKARAAQEEITVNEAVIKAIRAWLKA